MCATKGKVVLPLTKVHRRLFWFEVEAVGKLIDAFFTRFLAINQGAAVTSCGLGGRKPPPPKTEQNDERTHWKRRWPGWSWSLWRPRTPRELSCGNSAPRGASGACCFPGGLQTTTRGAVTRHVQTLAAFKFTLHIGKMCISIIVINKLTIIIMLCVFWIRNNS